MSTENSQPRIFRYHWNQPDGIPEDFPNRDKIFVLMDVFHGKGGSFQRLLDCDGIRYILLLEHNEDEKKCSENNLLERMYEGYGNEDIHQCRLALSEVADDIMKMFWPYLNRDFKIRNKKGCLMKPIGPLDYDRKDSHKLRLKTVDGSLCAMEHSTHVGNRCDPFPNPFADLRCFRKSEVEILEMITTSVFRVRVGEQEYALKAGRSDIMRTVEKLHSLPVHANIVSLSGVLADGDGRIMGILMPFISNESLWRIPFATLEQKKKWKAKISEAMNFLRDKNIVWGDAKADNILINKTSDEPVLIDFEGGQTDGWVDEDLRDTREGDLQALARILRYVDDIPTREV